MSHPDPDTCYCRAVGQKKGGEKGRERERENDRMGREGEKKGEEMGSGERGACLAVTVKFVLSNVVNLCIAIGLNKDDHDSGSYLHV